MTKLGIELGNTNTKLEEQRQKTDEQREKAAAAEKSLLELQQLIKEPRTIDRQTADKILVAGSKGSVDIGFVTNTDEPAKLGAALRDLLASNGWAIAYFHAFGGSPVTPGIKIFISGSVYGEVVPPDKIPEPAKTLYECLRASVKDNPSLEVLTTTGIPNELIRVRICPKY